MTRRIPALFSIATLLLVIFISCETGKKTSVDQSGIIVESIPLTEIDSYLETILNLEEYNLRIPDQTKTRLYYSFDGRKLTINDSVYYHVELWKTRLAGLEESTIPTPEIVAYFRILPATKQILILDKKNDQFLDLADQKGKAFLEKCMK